MPIRDTDALVETIKGAIATHLDVSTDLLIDLEADGNLDTVAAAIASILPPTTSAWQPIKTAPKDGTEIDLWVRTFEIGVAGAVSVSEHGRRPNAWWGTQREIYLNPTEIREGTEEGWVYHDAPHILLIEMGTYRVTHWMPLSDPPALNPSPTEQGEQA